MFTNLLILFGLMVLVGFSVSTLCFNKFLESNYSDMTIIITMWLSSMGLMLGFLGTVVTIILRIVGVI